VLPAASGRPIKVIGQSCAVVHCASDSKRCTETSDRDRDRDSVCVCERERGRSTARNREREKERQRDPARRMRAHAQR